jgi:hypothetical protein
MVKKNLLLASVAFVVIALVIVGRTNAVTTDDAQPDKKQVMKFSHSKHAGAGIECASCHTPEKLTKNAAEKMLPTHTECQSCHEQEVNEKCSFCHTDESNPVALPNPVREVLFDHQKHVTDQKMECVTCHAGMDKTDFAEAANMPSYEDLQYMSQRCESNEPVRSMPHESCIIETRHTHGRKFQTRTCTGDGRKDLRSEMPELPYGIILHGMS